jgi:putative DNA primase/helicase
MTERPHDPALAAPPTELSAVCVLALIKTEIADREEILAPWLRQRDIAMLHAPRGCGKTLAALTVGLTVASGGKFMEWSAKIPRKVLYVDGEMPARAMQDRLKGLLPPYERNLAPKKLRMITPDIQDRAIPDLSTLEGQDLIDRHLQGVDLLILDNLSTLCRTGIENEAESWAPVQAWLLALRRRGMTVLLIHHSGKNGLQRGTSRREDVLDVVIGLRRPKDYNPSEGARFELHFEKARGIYGPAVDTREVTLRTDVNGTLEWSWRTLVDRDAEDVAKMLGDGLSIRAAAEELGLSKSKVERLKRKAQKMGIFDGS